MGVGIAFESAWDALSRDMTRTVLVGASIAIGVFLTVLVGAIAAEVQQAVQEATSSVAAERFAVARATDLPQRTDCPACPHQLGRALTFDDLASLSGLSSVAHVVPVEAGRASVKVRDVQLQEMAIQAAGAAWAVVEQASIVEGRDFTSREQLSGANALLLNEKAAKYFFRDASPLDSTVTLDGRRFRVVGIYHESLLGGRDGSVPQGVVPIRAAKRELGDPLLSMQFLIEPYASQIDAVDDVIGALRQVHRLRPRQPNDFDILDQNELLRAIADLTSRASLTFVSVGILAMLIGGVGIASSMSIAVRQRTVEIGIRKAMGATRTAVLLHFVIEAVLLAFAGGIGGTLLAAVSYVAISNSAGLPLRAVPWSIIIGTTATILVGVGFGILPSLHAARLAPSDALRRA